MCRQPPEPFPAAAPQGLGGISMEGCAPRAGCQRGGCHAVVRSVEDSGAVFHLFLGQEDPSRRFGSADAAVATRSGTCKLGMASAVRLGSLYRVQSP